MKIKQKNKAILFDFMRTLYDPESGHLIYGVKRILEVLHKDHDLYLISYRENQRESLIHELNIEKYFKKISFVEKKTRQEFKKVIGKNIYSRIWVIGDRIEDEIIIGNALGWRTIWVAQGKFKHRIPKLSHEYPSQTINNIRKTLKLFYRQNKN